MQVASLAMVEGVSSTRGRSVVSRWLIGEVAEGEAIRVEERWREAPWFVVSARRRISIFDVVLITVVSVG